MIRPADVLEEATKELGHEPNDTVWKILERLGRVQFVLEEAEDGLEVEALRELLSHYRFIEQQINGSVRHQGTLGPDVRFAALSEILAIDAGRRDDVVNFRREVLRGRLIKFDAERVRQWVKRQDERDGRRKLPHAWVRLPLSLDGSIIAPDHPIDLSSSDSQTSALEALRPFHVRRLFEEEMISYAVPGDSFAPQKFIRLGGTLHRLKALCTDLSETFGWSEAHAVLFVLTDWRPPVSLGTWTVHQRSWHPYPAATERVEINASTRLAPKDVASMYVDARSQVQPDHGRTRTLTHKSALLAVFAFEINDGRTWAEAMGEWNRQQPKSKYARRQLFARDCRLAYERVTGNSLSWQGGRT